LIRVDGVADVRLIADPGEQITIELEDAAARRLGISAPELAAVLAARNRTVGVGAARIAGRKIQIAPGSELGSLEELEQTAITLPSGASLPLVDLARVRRGPAEPTVERMRYDLEPAVGLAVIARPDIDVVALGESLRAAVAAGEADLEARGLRVAELSFQPDYVERRLADLGGSLLFGIAIVAGVLFLAMGIRLGAVVVLVVPLVALAALAIYWFGGGVLHQLSIAALILSLGLLVDNAIVVAEAAQHKIDAGLAPSAAAVAAARELAFPLATATGTTVAAFVPMLLSAGPTGDFTRAIPVVASVTLILSYLFAVTVTPLLVSLFLRRRRAAGPGLFGRVAGAVAGIGARHPRKTVAIALAVVAVSASGALVVDQSFFPRADRDQLVVEVILPEGSSLEETDRAALAIERFVRQRPEVVAVSSTVGRSAPRFYYNLPNRPQVPHFANLVVATRSSGDIATLMAAIDEHAREHLPAADVIPRRLEQGPPLEAPIEVRFYGEDLTDLYQAAAIAMGELRRLPGVTHVRHDLGGGQPTARVRIDDAAAARHGLSRAEIAATLVKQLRGLPVGELRAGDDPVPIAVRSPQGESLDWERLASAEAAAAAGPIPVGQIAALDVEWRPAVIAHRNRHRVVTVSAQLADGVGFGKVLAALGPRLEAAAIPAGIDWDWGGEAEGADDANRALGKAAPFGAVLLVFFLLIEFNSFRRLLIIVSAVPLAAAGVIPGLLLAGQPFGFMSMLGVFALVGLVVNNAIVLISVVDARRAEGVGIDQALAEAVRLRTRPILLTTLTTVAGLLPLALSSSPLWPPMATTMIAGLIASTALTLVVVPALYRLLFRDAPILGRLGGGAS
jgi:multidrug efflux pump subunit AcrB